MDTPLVPTSESDRVDDLGDLAPAIIDLANSLRRRANERVHPPILPNSAVEILRVIHRHPGIGVAEVAQRLGRRTSNVSAQLRELDDLGLVIRDRDPQDGRHVVLRTTPYADATRARVEASWSEDLRTESAHLPPEDREALARARDALRRLADRW